MHVCMCSYVCMHVYVCMCVRTLYIRIQIFLKCNAGGQGGKITNKTQGGAGCCQSEWPGAASLTLSACTEEL